MKAGRWLAASVLALVGGVTLYWLVLSPGTTKAVGPRIPTSENRVFGDVGQAQAYLGYPLKTPKVVPAGWRLKNVVVTRTGTPQRADLTYATLTFEDATPGTHLAVMETQSQIERGRVSEGSTSLVSVGGTEGELTRGGKDNPNLVVLSWENGKLHIQAYAILGGDFTLDQFLSFAESLE